MLFSIIVPTYNAAFTIKKCLDSVFKQSFSDFEVIVVNDCSTDNTEEIINQYNIKQIVLEKNSGPAAARNVGIKQAQGDIIIFIDADVTFRDNDSLFKLAKIFKEKKNIDGVIMIKDKVPLNIKEGLTPFYIAYYKYYLWNQPGEYQSSFTTERSAVKKYVFDKVGYFDDKYKKADVEDFEFGYRMNELGYKFYIARHIKVLHHFETFKQLTHKTLKRSWQWIRLFLKRKKFDPVYSTKERGIKTLIGATIFPLVILFLFIPYLYYVLIIMFAIYLFYAIGFYWFLVKEKKLHLVIPFMILDLYFNFLTMLGAGFSTLFYIFKRK